VNRGLTVLTVLVVTLSAAALSGCTSSPSANCRHISAGDASDAITATGDFGASISLTVPATLDVTSLERTVVTRGEGAEPKSGETVNVEISIFSGATGGPIHSLATKFHSFDDSLPTPVRDAIECLPVGSRSVTVFPGSDLYTASQLAQVNLEPNEPVVIVADIVGIDEAPKVYQWHTGIPTVDVGEDGLPSLSLEGASRPAGIYVAEVKTGSGDVVAATDSVTVNYLGVVWSTGEVFDGNFGSAPAQFSLDNVIEGFRLGLVGQKVGTEVLVSIPAAYAYGESTSSSSSQLAGQDLLFLIDVVATQHATKPTP
jgi:peptidylprolyl isomerase